MEKLKRSVSSIRVSLLLTICFSLLVSQLLYLAGQRAIDSAMLDLLDPRPDAIAFVEGRSVYIHYGESPSNGSEVADKKAFDRLRLLLQISPILIYGVCIILAVCLYYHFKLRRPIGSLNRSIEKIARQELDFSVAPGGSDELGQLCGAVESMRFQLEKAFRSLWAAGQDQQNLYRAFAHDLRTPLTIIRGNQEIIAQVAAKNNDWNQALESVVQTEQAAQRIEQYADQLKKLESLDEYPLQLSGEDLVNLAFALRKEAEILARLYKKEVMVEVAATGTVQLDAGLVHRVVDNLMQNAMAHAAGTMKLRIESRNEGIAFTVEDDGPGFAPGALERAAAPFFTMDKSGAHMGIGLTVAHKLAARCGGKITLENNTPGAIATFFIPV